MIKISEATPKDAQAIQEVKEKAWLIAYPNRQAGITISDVRKQFAQNVVRERTKALKETLNSESDSRFFVAKDDGLLIGFLSLIKNPDWEIGSIYILPEYHRRGVGSKLMDKALHYIGPGKIRLMVADYNTPAILFYQKFGFQKSGRQGKKELISGKVIRLLEMTRQES